MQDPEYLRIVEEFAEDQAALDTAFSHAWYVLLRGLAVVGYRTHSPDPSFHISG